MKSLTDTDGNGGRVYENHSARIYLSGLKVGTPVMINNVLFRVKKITGKDIVLRPVLR